MSSIQGLDDYTFGRKNNWRGWAWNRITERIPVSVEDARVLYLCGPADIDRAEGLKRGYLNHNLIAVDSSGDNISAVRKSGGYGICGDVADVIASCPSDFPIHAVIADFCQGLHIDFGRLMSALYGARCLGGFAKPHLLCNRESTSTVLCVNLQRGRDPGSLLDESRKSVLSSKNYDNSSIAWPSKPWFDDRLQSTAKARYAVHRGLMAFDRLKHYPSSNKDVGSPSWKRATSTWVDYLACSNPVFFSYMGGRVYFDSVVLNYFGDPNDPEADRFIDNPATTRKWAALKAIQTQRGVA